MAIPAVVKAATVVVKDKKLRNIVLGIIAGFLGLILVLILMLVYILATPIMMLNSVITDSDILDVILDFKTEYQVLMPNSSGGYGMGGTDIVAVALAEDGKASNIAGQTYWRWYGFAYRDEWCAMFVSWCADQCGYIESGVIPKFAYVPAGAEWFKEKGQYQSRSSGYLPKPGDIVFISWGGNGSYSHVGIVESCDGTYVNTIEGNTGVTPGYYKIRRNEFTVNDLRITGYGTPDYPTTSIGDEDLDWFYRCIEAESGNQPYDGKVAVAQCIIFSSQRKGESLKDVICSPDQYSCVSDGRIYEVAPSAESIKAGDEALAGKLIFPKGTEYFINYEAAKVSWWHQQQEFMGKIGDHSFYRAANYAGN
jgi:hypothetical protein